MMTQLKFLSLFCALLCWASCKSTQPKSGSAPEAGMFKVTILYPNGEGKTFDMDYYQKIHMSMVAGFIGKNLKFYEIDQGISGRAPGDPVPFLAIGYFYIQDIAEYNKAIAQNRDAIVKDFKNYTNVQPVVQISQVQRVVYPDKK